MGLAVGLAVGGKSGYPTGLGGWSWIRADDFPASIHWHPGGKTGLVSHGPVGISWQQYMRLVFPTPEQNEVLSNWVSDRLGGSSKAEAECLAVIDDDALIAVVKYFNYRWPSIEVSFVSEDSRWILNRGIVRGMLAYPFFQLKCKRVTAVIDRRNKRARKMVKGLGFVEEGKIRHGSEHGDCFLYGLLPDEFRFKWKNS